MLLVNGNGCCIMHTNSLGATRKDEGPNLHDFAEVVRYQDSKSNYIYIYIYILKDIESDQDKTRRFSHNKRT